LVFYTFTELDSRTAAGKRPGVAEVFAFEVNGAGRQETGPLTLFAFSI